MKIEITPLKDDPIIAEIRKVRHKISAACGHDTKRLAKHYRKFEQKLRKSGRFRFSDEPKAVVATNDAK